MNPLETLRYHVTGAIERGEDVAIVGQPAPAKGVTLKTYRIRLYTMDGRTRWMPNHARIFGERNEGVTVEAVDPAAAVEAFNADRLPAQKFNPFYLKIEEVQS